MTSAVGIIFYVLIFLSLYVQVFFLVTFLENKKKIVTRKGSIKLSFYPAVTVIVPCWNEEKTIVKTVQSLLDLNYPQDKLEIFLVDDGSADNTWAVIKTFEKYSNIKIFKKENGGKHTALNLGLENLKTDFIGCLDADSIADKESLVRIMSYFEKDETTMAVAPSIIANNPTTIIQHAQKAEYYMAVYVKKMLAFLSAIHVTPGPLTIFRKRVFDELGTLSPCS
jgi:cellulose synthase/poly-beta-1,6-N-acetylglucosamine synthase-like glycosyltransferase